MKKLNPVIAVILSLLFWCADCYAQNITTVAGMGGSGYNGDGIPATAAQLNVPLGIIKNTSGEVIFADAYNSRIRKISITGIISTIAGGGFDTLDGPAMSASLRGGLRSIANDTLGNIYFTEGCCVRKIDTAGNIHTIAGAYLRFISSGDGGAATAAGFEGANWIILDKIGGIYVAENNKIRYIDNHGIISTVAGTGASGFSGDGGAATSAQFNGVLSVALDSNRNLFVLDCFNYRVRKIDTFGIITTTVGTGSSGFSGDGAAATAARIKLSASISIDSRNNLYIMDAGNCRIRKVTSTGTIVTIAGNGGVGYSGDGIAATAANLDNPSGAFIDGSGNVYISEYGPNRIRKIDTFGFITTIAGMGNPGFTGDGGSATAARLFAPQPIAVDRIGNLFIFDGFNRRIRKVSTSGIISTIAGNGTIGETGDGGPASSALLGSVTSIIIDKNGSLLLNEEGVGAIRKIDTFGNITRFAGTGPWTYSGDGSPATATSMFPAAIAVDTNNNVFVADIMNSRVLKISNSGIVTTIAGNGTPGDSLDGGPATAACVSPWHVSTDKRGNVYVGTVTKIRKISATGIISRIAGTDSIPTSDTAIGDGGPATAAHFCVNGHIHVDSIGNIFFADFSHHRIRKIDTSGIISTVYGNGIAGFAGDGGSASHAQFYGPCELISDSFGNWFVSEQQNHTIRKIFTCPGLFAGSIAFASVCVGAVTTLTDSAGTTGGVWSCSSTGVATITTTGMLYGFAAGTVAVTYTVTNACTSAYTTRSINVITSPPAGSIIGAASVCLGATATLADSAGTSGGTWSSGATSIASINSSTRAVRGMAVGSATITYSVTNTCGTNITTRSINVITTSPPGAISGATTFCQGTTSSLASSGATGGVWTSSTVGVASVNSSGIVSGVSAGTATITYTVTNVCGSAFTTTTVHINPLATPGVVSGLSSICVGTSTLFTASGTTGGTWSSSNASIASVNTSGTVYGITAGSAVISYAVTNVCGTVSAIRTITVIAPPATAGTITGPATVCSGAHITLADTVAGGSWGSGSTHATINSTGVVTGLSAGAAVISYTLTNACGSASATYTITVIGTPHAGPVTGATSTCPAASITLTGAMPGGNWATSAAAIATVDTAGVVTGVAVGTATITYVITNSCGTDTAYKVIVIDPLPDAGIITGTDSVCPGLTVTLTDAVTGGTWGSSNAGLASVSSAGVVTGVASGAATISYSFTNSCGTANATYPFTVLPIWSCPNAVASITVVPVQLLVSPNPNNGRFVVTINSPANEEAPLQITNLLGQVIFTRIIKTNASNDLQLYVAPGMYFASVVVKGERIVGKVVVE